MQDNFINLKECDLDKPIYRIIKLEDLIKLLKNENFVLVNPTLWEDTYELFISKAKFTSNKNTSIKNLDLYNGVLEKIFCSCWSFTAESDAMWRIYANDKTEVRIKTTINKFVDSFNNHDFSKTTGYKHNNFQKDFYAGRVKYKNEGYFKSFLENEYSLTQTDVPIFGFDKIMKSFCRKRTNFSHENEIRFFYYDNESVYSRKNKLYKFDINSNSFIDEITFNPFINDALFSILSEKIQKLNYTGIVNKSNLYGPLEYNIKF
jgi:hypothetical protein